MKGVREKRRLLIYFNGVLDCLFSINIGDFYGVFFVWLLLLLKCTFNDHGYIYFICLFSPVSY